MKKQRITSIKTFSIGTSFPSFLSSYLPEMRKIYHELFEVSEDYDLNNLLQHRGEHIKLGLFFDIQNRIRGFAIAGIQKVHLGDETHALFSAGAYSDLNISAGSAVVKFALTQSIKYKLKNPSHKLAYLEEALSPAPYSLSSRALPECYPSPIKKTPSNIQEIIQCVYSKRGYMVSDANEWVVRFPIKRKIKNYQKILNSKKFDDCKYFKYYMKMNPDFINGDALLVFIPLSFKNILRSGLDLFRKGW